MQHLFHKLIKYVEQKCLYFLPFELTESVKKQRGFHI